MVADTCVRMFFQSTGPLRILPPGGSGASGSMTTGERLDKLDKELNETRAKVCFCCADTLFTPPILNISLFFRSTSLPTR